MDIVVNDLTNLFLMLTEQNNDHEDGFDDAMTL